MSGVKRTAYHREWCRKHPGYKTADSRLRALFRPAKRPFFREILGVKVRVNLLAWFLGIPLALFCLPAHAQERKAFTVPFHDVKSLIVLDAQVNGKKVALVLDTGAMQTQLDRKAAGQSATYSILYVDLQMGNYRARSFRILATDLQRILRDIPTADGILGQDWLRSFRAVRIDYKAHTVTLED